MGRRKRRVITGKEEEGRRNGQKRRKREVRKERKGREEWEAGEGRI